MRRHSGPQAQLEAVIFDMDGVIVNSEPCHEQAFLDVVRELGCFDRLQVHYADYVGRSDQELWAEFAAKHKPGLTQAELLERKTRRVVEIIRRDRPVFDRVPALVEALAGRYRLALASGSVRASVEEVLALEGLRRFFSATISDSEVERGKPAPDIFLCAANLLDVAPSNCWVIEDSKPGIAAALAANMRVIAIANTHPPAELQAATYVVSTYGEIERLLVARA